MNPNTEHNGETMRLVNTDKIFVRFQCNMIDCIEFPIFRTSVTDLISCGPPMCPHCNVVCERLPEKAEVEH
jgi:hypothetical protein